MCTLNKEVKTLNVKATLRITAYKAVNLMVDDTGRPRYKPVFSTNYPKGGWTRYATYTSHAVPKRGQAGRVGFHVFKTPAQAFKESNNDPVVAVIIWGKVVEHTNGYRAQYIRF